MAAIKFPLLLLLLLTSISTASPSPYLSPKTLFQNYQSMLTNFKVYTYTPSNPQNPQNPTKTPASLFYTSLLNSSFLTQNPSEAHLFFVPLPPDALTTRSLSSFVRDLRTVYPYWNRTLGADHFFISPSGIDYSSDRHALELKKNAVQVSVFPVTSGFFVPHKDVTLPPFDPSLTTFYNNNNKYDDDNELEGDKTRSFLGYLKWDGLTDIDLVNGVKLLVNDFLVEEMEKDYVVGARKSKFCLFLYSGGDVDWFVGSMRLGCVPVVIVDRPVQDLPLMDVLKWSDLGLVVGVGKGGAGRLREILSGVSEERYKVMRDLGVEASKHLIWNADGAKEYDAFHMVMYQLWVRRHVVRYSRREFADE